MKMTETQKKLYQFLVLNGKVKNAIGTDIGNFILVKYKDVSFILNADIEKIEMIYKGKNILWVQSDFVLEAIHTYLNDKGSLSEFVIQMYKAGEEAMNLFAEEELKRIYKDIVGDE